MEKVDITVYASATGLFTEEECDEDNLTQISVEADILKQYLAEKYTGMTINRYLDTYTADMSEPLVWWLLDNGYGLDVYGRTVYRYGMKYRPFDIGCQPKDGFLWRENDPSGKYHDIISYMRPLSDRELADYQLETIN